MKVKPKVKKYPNGGRPQFEWSKGIDNIQPITQTQNNSSITTGNKKLSTEELKKAAEYTKKYNQQHLEEEYNNRQNKLKQSIDAQKQPLSLKNLQTQTQSTGDKFSLAMNSKYGNPKDYPTLSGYMQGLDYINPAKMIGDMTSGLGSVPQDVNDGNYLKAGLSVASPLFTGAVAGIGTQGLKPFVNNIVNPLAGVKNPLSKKSINTFKPQFESEINWGKWNKEIPDNPQLMKEYNAIEQSSKADGTWMRNSDGSTFEGSPEQFVQQNSQNFKKAFGESIIRDEKGNIVKMYHGSINEEPLTEYITPKRLENFKRRTQTTKETDHTFFSPKKEIADKYSKRDLLGNDKGIIYENYINVKNPYFTDNYIDVAMPHDLPDINSYDAVTNMKFGKDYSPKDYSELAIPFGNNVKSAIGNNGMFDMTNPNIYKSILPIGLGLGAASQIDKKQNGGSINKYPNGGREPIVGTPQQYQAYQDSLFIHNDGERMRNLLINPNTTENSYGNEVNRYYTGNLLNLNNPTNQAISRLNQLNGEFPAVESRQNRTFPSGYTAYASLFKKPIQPIILDRPKENITTLSQEQRLLPETEKHLEFDPIGLKKGTYFTRPRQQQEAGQGSVDYFDNKTGKLLKTMENGGNINSFGYGGSLKKYLNGGDLKNAYSITADALSLFPPTSGLGYVMGLPTTAYAMYEDYQKGDIKQMGLDAMGLIPAFKLMKYSKFAKSATQGINMASKFNKAVDVANMANDVNQTIEKKEFGGNITRESEWELVNETNKKLPKRRLNLNKSSDWEIVD